MVVNLKLLIWVKGVVQLDVYDAKRQGGSVSQNLVSLKSCFELSQRSPWNDSNILCQGDTQTPKQQKLKHLNLKSYPTTGEGTFSTLPSLWWRFVKYHGPLRSLETQMMFGIPGCLAHRMLSPMKFYMDICTRGVSKRILILFQHLRRHVSESFNISNRSDILYLWIKHGHSGQFRVENFPRIALLSPASLVAGQDKINPPFPPNGRNSLSLHRGSVAARNLRTVMLAPG